MVEVSQLWDFLQELTPLTRSCLLSELERLELCGVDMPGSADIRAKLRAEFRKDGSPQSRSSIPSHYFFAPLEPLIVDGAPEHANTGHLARSSLTPIWEWVCRDLLPTMARDYVKAITVQTTAKNDKEARKIAAAFHTKVVKVLEAALASPDRIEQIRSRLARYTASQSAVDDVTKLLIALRARDALAAFDQQLPHKIVKLSAAEVAKTRPLLDSFKKANPDALPFALALVQKRLKTPWQLIRFATKASSGKNAAEIAATPYAIAISMALDVLDNKRVALKIALKYNRAVVAQALLADIYASEYALRVRIDQLEQSPWGMRLQQIMNSVAALVEAEVSRFPDEVRHILDSRQLRSHESLKGRLTYLAWKGRDAVQDGAAYCRKLIGST